MAQKLVYTSSPKGLHPGAYGFCVVASTRGIPDHVANFLASTSGYRRVFSPESGKSALNPVSYTHMLVDNFGQTFRILSRVADAGLDYTNRTNKIASFLLPDRNELASAGPAALFNDPGLFYSAWNQAPTWLDPTPIPNPLESPTTLCYEWKRVMGAPDWGAALAATVYSGAPVALVYAPDRNVNVLKLFQESIRLLPVNLRWNATFSTYFTQAPLGAQCQWKAVLAGSNEEANLRANPRGLVFDLTLPGGAIPDVGLNSPNGAQLLNLARGVAPTPQPSVMPVPPIANASPQGAFPHAPQPQGAQGFPGAQTPPFVGGNASPGIYATSGIEVPRGAKPLNYGRELPLPEGERTEDPILRKRRGKKASSWWMKTLFYFTALLVSLGVCILLFCFVPGLGDGVKGFLDHMDEIKKNEDQHPDPPANTKPSEQDYKQNHEKVAEEEQVEDSDNSGLGRPSEPVAPANTAPEDENDGVAQESSNDSETAPIAGKPEPTSQNEKENGVGNQPEDTNHADDWQNFAQTFKDEINNESIVANIIFNGQDTNLTEEIADYEGGKDFVGRPGVLVIRDKNEEDEPSSLHNLLTSIPDDENITFKITLSKETGDNQKQGTTGEEDDIILSWSLSGSEIQKDGFFQSEPINLSPNQQGTDTANLVLGKKGWLALLVEKGNFEGWAFDNRVRMQMSTSRDAGDSFESNEFEIPFPCVNSRLEVGDDNVIVVSVGSSVQLPYRFSRDERPGKSPKKYLKFKDPLLVAPDGKVALSELKKKEVDNESPDKINIKASNAKCYTDFVCKITCQNDDIDNPHSDDVKIDFKIVANQISEDGQYKVQLELVELKPEIGSDYQKFKESIDKCYIVFDVFYCNNEQIEKNCRIGKLKIPCRPYPEPTSDVFSEEGKR